LASSQTPLRVGVTGSYGGLNLGDEAILQVVLGELRRIRPGVELTVFSRNAEDTQARHPGVEAVAVRELSRAEARSRVERLDVMILGGGGVLFDGEAGIFLRELEIAEELGIPTIVWAIGAGPLEKAETQDVVRRVLERASAVTVRERRALQVLEDAGVRREIEVTADPALLLEPEPLSEEALLREGLDPERRLVGISVREPGAAAPDIEEEHYHALLANAADYVVERLDADLVFVPMERNVLDVQHSHRVIGQMSWASRATVLKGDYSPGEIASLVGRFELAVGMRLHFLIFAALAGVPIVALPYAGKVIGLLEALEIDAPPMKTVNAGRLIAYLDRSWDLRDELTRRLPDAVAGLRERSRRNAEIAAAVIDRRLAARGDG
jgi:polysaccharide pyruvyl transferase CsaB